MRLQQRQLNNLKFKILNKFFINPTKTADTYIYNSHYTEQESNAFFGAPKIPGTIVGCPISKGFLEPFEDISPDSKKLFWERFGIKNFNAVCLNISLDEPRKNLKTFFQLAKEKPELAFVRVGRLRKETHDLIQTMNLKNLFHFENLDFSTLRDFYRNASVFIYPSFLEGFGLPPLEALASKIPVISSKTSALEENLNGILDYCIESNVKGILCFGMGMTLREGNREYFYSKLDKHFPGLKEKYIKTYGNNYGIASPNQKELMKIFYKRTNENNIMNNPDEIFEYLHEFPSKDKTKQTTLF